MTIIYPGQEWLTLPKVTRCYQSECNIYQLILQKRSTNSIIVFKLRDVQGLNDAINPLRYNFPFLIPDSMQFGEYNLFVVRPYEWGAEEINDLFVKNTYRQTDKQAVTLFGDYIMSDGRILVTSAKNVQTGMYDSERNIMYISTEFSEDKRPCGEMYEDLRILYRGLLKYLPDPSFYEDGFVQPNLNNNEYVEYNG